MGTGKDTWPAGASDTDNKNRRNQNPTPRGVAGGAFLHWARNTTSKMKKVGAWNRFQTRNVTRTKQTLALGKVHFTRSGTRGGREAESPGARGGASPRPRAECRARSQCLPAEPTARGGSARGVCSQHPASAGARERQARGSGAGHEAASRYPRTAVGHRRADFVETSVPGMSGGPCARSRVGPSGAGASSPSVPRWPGQAALRWVGAGKAGELGPTAGLPAVHGSSPSAPGLLPSVPPG